MTSGGVWSEQSVQGKQLYEEKAAEQKEKHEKVIATYCARAKVKQERRALAGQ